MNLGYLRAFSTLIVLSLMMGCNSTNQRLDKAQFQSIWAANPSIGLVKVGVDTQAKWDHGVLIDHRGTHNNVLPSLPKKARLDSGIHNHLVNTTQSALTAGFVKSNIAFSINVSDTKPSNRQAILNTFFDTHPDTEYAITLDIYVADSNSLSMVKKGQSIRVLATWLIANRSGNIVHEVQNSSIFNPSKALLKTDAAYYSILATLQTNNSEFLVNYLAEMINP